MKYLMLVASLLLSTAAFAGNKNEAVVIVKNENYYLVHYDCAVRPDRVKVRRVKVNSRIRLWEDEKMHECSITKVLQLT